MPIESVFSLSPGLQPSSNRSASIAGKVAGKAGKEMAARPSQAIKPGAMPLRFPMVASIGGPKQDMFLKTRPSSAMGAPTHATKPSVQAPRFAGQWATRNAALGKRDVEGFFGSWPLTGKQLKNFVMLDDDPYVGQSPMMLQNRLGLNHEQLCEVLDNLAEELRPDPDMDTPVWDRIMDDLYRPTETRPVNGHPVTLKKVGEGSFGMVYRLNDGEKSYAFKVHKDLDSFDGYSDHSAYQEAATGQYLTAHNINKDAVRFYVANPKMGWTLTEFVTSHGNRGRREGKTMHEAGIRLSDERYNNRIDHIRVDLGGAVRPVNPNSDPRDYIGWESGF